MGELVFVSVTSVRYVGPMLGDCGLTIDELEQREAECVALVSGATARMLSAIRALDTAQVAGVDGCGHCGALGQI